MKKRIMTAVICMLFLSGCTAAKIDSAAYEEYKDTVARLDRLAGYHVSSRSYDHHYARDYEYVEISETDVTVNAIYDEAVEVSKIYFVYDDQTKKDVTCDSSELAGCEQSTGCELVHHYQYGKHVHSDGLEEDAANHMSQEYFLILDNAEQASFQKNGAKWTIKGESDAGNEYVATMVVDDNGIPEQFTYTYEDLGITMIRTVSQIREEQ